MQCHCLLKVWGHRFALLVWGLPIGLAGCTGDTGTGQSPPVASVVIQPHADSLEIGESVQLSARTLDARGDTLTGRAITWSSNDTTIIMVNGAGLLTGRAVGSTAIIATSEGISGTTSSRVVIAAVASVTISPAADTVALNGVTQYTAIARDARNVVLAGRPVAWSTSNSSLASVSTSGGVTAIGPGSATITATVEGRSGTALFTTLRSFASMHPGGWAHSCGLTAAGEAWCWGWNYYGSLGTGTFTDSPFPVAVGGGHTFTQLTASNYHGHTCGLIAGGQAFCWGSAWFGQLGNGAGGLSLGIDLFLPEPVLGGLSFTSLAAGAGRTCGIATDGNTYCWGLAVIAGVYAGSNVPALVGGAVALVSVAVGQYGGDPFVCGLTSGGAAYCWGANSFGQLGVGDTLDRVVPTAVLGGHTFTQLAAGGLHACGLTTAGSIYCWGINNSAALGAGRLTAHETVPVPVASNQVFASVTAGSNHSCGLAIDGKAFCWGANGRGSLGIGPGGYQQAFVTRPTQVSGGLTFGSLVASEVTSCGIATDGLAYCWGMDTNGVLGNGVLPLPISISIVNQPGKVVFR